MRRLTACGAALGLAAWAQMGGSDLVCAGIERSRSPFTVEQRLAEVGVTAESAAQVWVQGPDRHRTLSGTSLRRFWKHLRHSVPDMPNIRRDFLQVHFDQLDARGKMARVTLWLDPAGTVRLAQDRAVHLRFVSAGAYDVVAKAAGVSGSKRRVVRGEWGGVFGATSGNNGWRGSGVARGAHARRAPDPEPLPPPATQTEPPEPFPPPAPAIAPPSPVVPPPIRRLTPDLRG